MEGWNILTFLWWGQMDQTRMFSLGFCIVVAKFVQDTAAVPATNFLISSYRDCASACLINSTCGTISTVFTPIRDPGVQEKDKETL